jgi:hypothetical protein
METTYRCLWAGVLALALLLAGCSTIGTAARATGNAIASTASAVGHAVGTAAQGAASIVSDTADEAEDELD